MTKDQYDAICALLERACRPDLAKALANTEGNAMAREIDELRRLLTYARDYVSEEVSRNRMNYGDRLMHRQIPTIKLLADIDRELYPDMERARE